MIRKLLDGLYLAAGWLAGIFLVIIFLLMMSLSIGRQIGVNVPAGDDFVAWSMVAMGFLALAHTFKSGEIIRMGLVIDRTRGMTRRIFEIFSLVVGVALAGFFAWHAVRMMRDSWMLNDLAQGVVPVPLWIPQSAYATGLIILTIAMIDELMHVLRGGWPRYAKEPPKTKEEVLERAAAGNL
ncbi:MAG: TRAP transporter small permease [Beijerinckiaceae bacterium]